MKKTANNQTGKSYRRYLIEQYDTSHNDAIKFATKVLIELEAGFESLRAISYKKTEGALVYKSKRTEEQKKQALIDAIEANTEAIKNVPKINSELVLPETLFINRGRCYQELGEDELALRDFSQAIKNNPLSINAYFYRSALYLKNNKISHALKDFWKKCEIYFPAYDPLDLAGLYKYNDMITAYEKLFKCGFIPERYKINNDFFLIYPNNEERIILEPKNIHVSKSYSNYLR